MATDYSQVSQGSVTLVMAAVGAFATDHSPVSRGNVTISMAAVPSVSTGYSVTSSGNIRLEMIAAGSRDFSMVQQSDISLSMTAVPTVPGAAITFAEVVDEILTIWGQRCGCCTDENMLEQAVSIVNSSLQQMWSRARDREYFARTITEVSASPAGIITIEQDYNDGTTEVPFQNLSSEGFSISSSTGVRLRKLSSKAEWAFFTQMYEGSGTVPKAYFMDVTRSETDQGLSSVSVYIVPNPGDGPEFQITYLCQAPRFTINDYTNGRRVALPHTYVESLLLPLVKYEALASFWAVKMEGKDAIQERYAFAQSMLDKFDPAPSGDKPNKQSKHEGDKA